jgi:hypothetical protein
VFPARCWERERRPTAGCALRIANPKSLTGRRGVENSHRPVPLASGWRRFLGGCYSYLSPVLDKLSIHTGLVISVMFGLSGFPVSSYPILEKPLKQPGCQANSWRRAKLNFWPFLEEKFLMKNFSW